MNDKQEIGFGYIIGCTECGGIMKVDKKAVHPTVGGEVYYCPNCEAKNE